MKRKGSFLWLVLLLLLGSCKKAEPLPWIDDFSSPGSWQAESDATAQVVVENGVLRVHVIVPNQLAWAVAGKDLRDFHLSVEATQVAGPDDNEYGVLVRMQDPSNFYRFSISGDGYFLVSKFVDGQQVLLGNDWTPSEAIHRGQATNVLEVTYRGNRFTFVVNGQQLAQGEDSQFSHGDIALYAGAFYEGGVEVHFDNLRVTNP
ncbi:MAG TPA: DUF1080 domain-containing protein [Thermoflexia bacterium]|jgi:hypothetical protein|nr:DUF1080 domain-containing protein [Thermoflexia bacterium]